MRPPVERLRAAVLAQLTARQAQACVIYLATTLIEGGKTVFFPRLSFACPWQGYVLFVDLDPSANWGHACCYMCIDAGGDKVHRVDAQFPPFRAPQQEQSTQQWQVIYRAPDVPEALLMIPQA